MNISGKRYFWKIYGFLFAVATIYIFFPTQKNLYEDGLFNTTYIFVSEIITTIAILLFAFNKRWLSKNIWKGWAIYYILWDIYDLKNIFQSTKEVLVEYPNLQPAGLFSVMLIVMSIGLSFPAYICLYIFAFKEK